MLRHIHACLLLAVMLLSLAGTSLAVAKAGVEDGHPLFACSCIVDPSGTIVAESKTEDDELIVADCDLDATKFGKETIFNFAEHRRIEHYGLITSQTGVKVPD